MELISIRRVSMDYGISRRMMCYYEEIGLIKSIRKDSSSFRLYDESAIKCLQQIIILRKLQIPMKQIKAILNNQNAVTVIEIFKRNINDIDEKITALSTVKSILERFVNEMREKANIRLELDVLNDKTMLAIVNTLSFSENKLKEKITMEELNKVSSKLEKRTDVRIVYLPPATIAVTKSFSSDHEQHAYVAVAQFAKDTNLLKIKPDARSFGFNIHENDTDGYEAWTTIPDDMEVPAPFVKKSFPGGLYACHTRAFQDLNYDMKYQQ